nr:sirohydrochlorin cobaltochelatase [uncultured Sulfurimonas sp.]
MATKKTNAIILTLFGSIKEQEKYLSFKSVVQKEFEESDVYIAVSSKFILKALQKRGFEYKNLAQNLADADQMGYKNIVVASITLFPTYEHEQTKKIVRSFKEFASANIVSTDAIFSKTKESTLFLKELDKSVSKKESANLYVLHGTPRLETAGLASVNYVSEYIEKKSSKNYTCSIEGAFPFFAIKEDLIEKMKKDGVKKVQIIPMLLVSGNHYTKDIVEMNEELNEHFKSKIVKSLTKSEKFNLLELDAIENIIIQNIKNSM